ncbi:hypothetical protein N6L24_10460 [Cognatishimia sp. SS12]|uniref:hypothetical protein n=1 Tax=Cognatishimia sp. SS12 TaxID=2979465 RepID=UPI00233071F1|nr:hypothetical protein [Cognatishimia sp. SS12]MDC0738703.1 hypothetical protein [Cognatishimia sp. SS12]
MRALILLLTLSAPDPGSAQELTPLGGIALGSMPGAATVQLAPRRVASRDLPDAGLRRARRNLVRGHHVSNRDLRALADLGEGNAAYHFAQRLRAQDQAAAEQAHYFGISLATGRDFAMGPFLAAVAQLPPGTPAARLRELRKILLAYVAAGDMRAVTAALSLAEAGRPFAGLLPDLREIATGDAPGSGPLALHFAIRSLHTGEDASARDRRDAARWLAHASTSAMLPVRLTAQNLLVQLASTTFKEPRP